MTKSKYFKNGELAWQLIEFPKIEEETGVLGVIEFGNEVDFVIKRIFFVRDVDVSSCRGFHAHKELKQFIFCAQGSFFIELDNGSKKQKIFLDKNSSGLYVDGKVWREMHSFSENSVMVVLCDREYRFDSVIREYEKFIENIARVEN